MKSLTTPDFWRSYSAFSSELKEQARKAYSGFHSDAVQHYITRCRGTAVPCPYGCTSRKREPLYRLWINNQFHPSLDFKKVGDDLGSVRISGRYRALALKKGEDYYWIWIGSHDEYETLIE
ncbi:MAG: hypothetical protein V7K50_19130 [Nostoc sp.]|uniref:ParE family toxin-like protein n=1 Tax=Nostoc sp. TaxID=1180 RepID=UPI00304EFBC1